ncbi:hypothetical protein Fmac_028772 [Flemingia macrophylla]|uniref:Uncharacterized protein n=1 Tax=Flemingia macrophylla TaxID=520843 RepID=A0ABD1L8X0_9FABA
MLDCHPLWAFVHNMDHEHPIVMDLSSRASSFHSKAFLNVSLGPAHSHKSDKLYKGIAHYHSHDVIHHDLARALTLGRQKLHRVDTAPVPNCGVEHVGNDDISAAAFEGVFEKFGDLRFGASGYGFGEVVARLGDEEFGKGLGERG